MKLFRAPWMIGLVTVAMAAGLAGCPGQGSVVTFKDENLETAIRSQLGKPFGFITTGDMLTLLILDARGFGITNLEGLERATNLQTLILNNNNVSDLRPISNLTVLQSLEFDNNQVFDLTPLQGLLSLRAVSLCGNNVSNVGPLVVNANDGGLGPNDQVVVDCNIETTDPINLAALLNANVDVVCCEGGSSN